MNTRNNKQITSLPPLAPAFGSGRNLNEVPEEASLLDSQAIFDIGSRRPNLEFANTKQTHAVKNKDVKSTLHIAARRDVSPSFFLEADSDTERYEEQKKSLPNGVLTQSLYIDPKDTTNFDISFVQKISIIMPHAIENSFILYTRKNEFGIKIKTTEKLQADIEESLINTGHVYYSDYMRYDGQNLYKKIMETLSDNKSKKFYDDFFPPTIGSLVPNTTVKKLNPNWQNVKWVRQGELYKSQKKELASQASTPNDVLHGYFGDVYLANILSNVSEFPKLINQIFGDKQQFNQYGLYYVRLFDNGVMKEVVVDDFIPCIELEPGYLEPAFAQPRIIGNVSVDIWVHLVIKAWAKLNGCYYNILHGKVDEAWIDFTGQNTQKILTNTSDLFNIILNYYNLGYGLMAVPSESRQFTLGVEPEITISLVRVCEVQLASRKEPIRLFKLRNVFRNKDCGEYIGMYSIGSSSWTRELMTALNKIEVDANRSNDEESCFWVDENEFVDLFTEVIVCYNFHNDTFESEKLRHKKDSFSMVQFNVKEKGFGVFCARQFDSRRLSGLVKKDQYEYSQVRLIICIYDPEEENWKMQVGKYGQCRDTVLAMNLNPGDYMCIQQAEWKHEQTYDITFRYTGNTPLHSVCRERMKNKPQFLRDSLVNKAYATGKFKAIDQKNEAEWMRVYFADSLLWVDIIKNNAQKKIYVQQFFEGSENITSQQETRSGMGQVTMLLESGKANNIVYRGTDVNCEMCEEEPAFS